MRWENKALKYGVDGLRIKPWKCSLAKSSYDERIAKAVEVGDLAENTKGCRKILE